MEKLSKIKWRPEDRTKLSKAVRAFNRKRERLIAKNPEIESHLPAKESVVQLKHNIGTRRDFNDTIARLGRFMVKGSEKLTTNDRGAVLTEYEIAEAGRALRRVNAQRAKRKEIIKKEAKNEELLYAVDKMPDYKPKKITIDMMTEAGKDAYLKTLFKQELQGHELQKRKLYKDNYLKAMLSEFGNGAEYRKLKKLIGNMSANKFVAAYYFDDRLQIKYIYTESEKKERAKRIIELWENYLNPKPDKNGILDQIL